MGVEAAFYTTLSPQEQQKMGQCAHALDCRSLRRFCLTYVDFIAWERSHSIRLVQDCAEWAGEVGDDAVDAVDDCSLHVDGVVDGPGMHFQTGVVCFTDEAAAEEPESE